MMETWLLCCCLSNYYYPMIVNLKTIQISYS